MSRTKAIIAASVLALGAGTAAYANDALAELAQAKITLAQVISAAEQHAGGRATTAGLERHNGKTAFEVEVVNGSAVSNIIVDATDGKVFAASADREDRYGEHEDE